MRNLQTVQALQFSVYEHFGVAWLGECGIGRKIGERFGLVPQIQKVPHLNAPLLEAIIRAIGNPDEMLGIMEWQAAEQKSVDDAEDCRTCADAEAHDCDREQRETGVAPQYAKRVAKILKENVQEGESADLPMGLPQLRDAAQFEPGQPFGFLWWCAFAYVIFGKQVEVSVDFCLKVSIEIAGLKNGANPGKYPVN